VALSEAESKALTEEIRAQNAKTRSEALAKAKTAAALAGKEKFDLAKLEKLVDTSSEGRVDPVEERLALYERKYYVEHPEIMTIAEFAKVVAELNSWR
jgi:hypothetical protein